VLKFPKSNLSYLPNLMHIPNPSSMHTLKRNIMRMETFLKQRRCATEFAELFQNGVVNTRGCYPLCTYSSEGVVNYTGWRYQNLLLKFWQKPNSAQRHTKMALPKFSTEFLTKTKLCKDVSASFE
jgi:hypothetical protein